MIVSALISQCRRVYGDVPKLTQSSRPADGVSTQYNTGKRPVMEGSYSVYFNTSAQTENSAYSLDKDSGDLTTISILSNGVNVKVTFKYANFRDQQWVEAINYGIEKLNGRGYFRQVVRDFNVLRLSAGVRTYTGPSGAIDLYELLQTSDQTISGSLYKLGGNWNYQQDANKIVLGYMPARSERLAASYLRNLKTYNASSATIDVLQDWIELVKKAAGEYYYRHMASKIATQGNATIDEGHFSFTNLRTMANDLNAGFEQDSQRKKPTRPAKDIQWHIDGGGNA